MANKWVKKGKKRLTSLIENAIDFFSFAVYACYVAPGPKS